MALTRSAAAIGGGRPDCSASSAWSTAAVSRSSQESPNRSARSTTTFEEKVGFRVESLLVAKSTFPAGPGSSPAAVSKSASRNAASSSPRPISRTATAAHFRAWRERQQPAQTGVERTRSSSDFNAMPAAKAAATSSGSRPRGRAQPGKPAGSTGEATRGVTGESMVAILVRICGLCQYFAD